jgi:hypothetical protein
MKNPTIEKSIFLIHYDVANAVMIPVMIQPRLLRE